MFADLDVIFRGPFLKYFGGGLVTILALGVALGLSGGVLGFPRGRLGFQKRRFEDPFWS